MPQQGLRQLIQGLLPAPPPPPNSGPIRPTGPAPHPRAAGLVDRGVDALLGALGVKDPLAPEATPATGIGAVVGMLSPMAAVGALKRVKNPIKAYHGSPERNLKTMSPNKAMEVRDSTWFTDNPDVASQYEYPREYGEILWDEPRGRTYEVNLHVENPLEVDMQGDPGEAIRLGKLVQQAKAGGHDALALRNVDDTVDSSRQLGTSYAVWNPDVIELLRKYGLLPPIAAGAAQASQPAPPRR